MDALYPIWMVAYPGALLLDVTGPLQVFAMANRFLPAPHYRTGILSLDGRAVETDAGVTLNSDGAFPGSAFVHRFGGVEEWPEEQELTASDGTLGDLFGTSSVISMLAIGEGASYEAQEQIKQLGSHNVILRSIKPPENPNDSRVSWSRPGKNSTAW